MLNQKLVLTVLPSEINRFSSSVDFISKEKVDLEELLSSSWVIRKMETYSSSPGKAMVLFLLEKVECPTDLFSYLDAKWRSDFNANLSAYNGLVSSKKMEENDFKFIPKELDL